MPLRPYQLAGVNWLIGCHKKKHGSILGDEMGLGKTCQMIAFLTYFRKSSKSSLVVCPRSVLENWHEEFRRFSPHMRVRLYIGEKEKRKDLADMISRMVKNGGQPFNILLTTYEICLKDDSFLSSIPWQTLVVDEAHRLKNNESLLYKTLAEWDIDHHVLLTGTPVQNNLKELYALLSFIAPRVFRRSGQEKFVNKYIDVTKTSGVSELHSLLKPYLLRRTKEAVLKDLPKKSDIVMYHGISKLQKKLYKAILTKDIGVFGSKTSGGSSTRLMNILMQLRKCVNHPYLFDGVEEEPFVLGEHLVETSGKLVLLDKLLGHLKTTGHKVLLFSQMTHMLDILQDYLGYRGYSYERLDGSVRGEERFLAVQNFNKNDETFAFLLSTKAGGQGLNLVAADTVVFVDSDFNPQNDLQAAARAHRIGQTRPVKVIRLVGRNTVEEIILQRAQDKLKLTEKVIEEGEFSVGVSKQDLIADQHVPLQDILKFGVDTLLSDEDSTDSDIDFNKILGSSVKGEWQEDEEVVESLKTEAEEDEDMEVETGPSSMYMFDGTDYSKEPSAADKKAFEQLIENERLILEEEVGTERPIRRKTTSLMGPLMEGERKPRKQLTPEELEERKKKRQEAAEKRAQKAKEEQIKKAEREKEKKAALWKANSYTSSRVTLDSDEEEETGNSGIDLSEDGEEERPRSTSIHYVSGDVTHPVNTKTDVNLIIHCADDSGRWGKGGLFTAISNRTKAVEEQYEMAANMKDLSLGDCHLISMEDPENKEDKEDWLILIIAQHRDRKNNLSGIKLELLSNGLKKVHRLAMARNASVHLPRIGYDTPGFNWYGTERLIKKHLAAKGTPTYIYYFPRRKHKQKKRRSSEDDDANEDSSMKTKEKKKKKKVHFSDDENNEDAEEKSKTEKPKKELPSLFDGMSFYIHPSKIGDDEMKAYKRRIIAYPLLYIYSVHFIYYENIFLIIIMLK
ncbi:hypothetical protein FSP39_013885 [Pinctada imbricata]|uniref:Chromodomain-helicase-DNA-binding protein 1-like protein n=1 Tax=Pinctada imbricata TaxID=66713 RepID=A0AA88YD30_PINIB|nr:hypothetical protein FSP39_013885 [Pinctada imbricata]